MIRRRTPAEGCKHLPELLPYYLGPQTNNALMVNIEIISEQQPEWLRQQIQSDLRRRHDPPANPMTSRVANALFWRNYRYKIRHVKELFGARDMSQVVGWCLNETGSSRSRATG